MNNQLYHRRCFGRFQVPTETLRDTPEVIMQMLAHVAITHAEMSHAGDMIIYTGVSSQFRPMEGLSVNPPTYRYELRDGSPVFY